MNNFKKNTRKQRGFTLVELSIVLLIIATLSILAYPKVRNYLIAGRVKPTADDITIAVARIRANAETQSGTAPYGAVETKTLYSVLVDRSTALITNASPIRVSHRLGSSNATVATVEATFATTTVANDSFELKFSGVSIAACADLATALNNISTKISIGTTPVKTAGSELNAVLAAQTCAPGEANILTFTIQ